MRLETGVLRPGPPSQQTPLHPHFSRTSFQDSHSYYGFCRDGFPVKTVAVICPPPNTSRRPFSTSMDPGCHAHLDDLVLRTAGQRQGDADRQWGRPGPWAVCNTVPETLAREAHRGSQTGHTRWYGGLCDLCDLCASSASGDAPRCVQRPRRRVPPGHEVHLVPRPHLAVHHAERHQHPDVLVVVRVEDKRTEQGQAASVGMGEATSSCNRKSRHE